ncbi:MAG TPA: class F sortase [Streptosporangiaceae bacterium]|nr:class F sortase [Streptosporangiaceae bacterium]
MSWPTSPGVQRRPGRWWLVAIVLLLAAAASFALGLGGQQRSLPGPLDPAGQPGPAPGARTVARSVPLTLSIPAIGLSVPLTELGLNSNHTVQVPTDFQEPGWYEYGPSPGQLGSSVILGHVDSYQGPAVFFRLRTLEPGDRVNVTLADGVITHFVVRQVAMYLKANFPTVEVYGPHGYSALQLVTCGGVFDTQTGHYLSNVVVYTSLVSTS